MESLSSLIQIRPQKKAPKHSFQETALEIIKLLQLDKTQSGIVWALYKRKGEQALNSLLGEIKQGEVKGEPIKYIKWLMLNK